MERYDGLSTGSRFTEVGKIGRPAYHHGDLRRVVLDAALRAIEETGPAGWSLRELARRAGVSHAAPAHHFGDKTGLLTAVAAQGFALFADTLASAAGDPLETGVAYVRFAIDHRAHFQVMFRPELYKPDDPTVKPVRERARDILADSVRTLSPGPEHDQVTTVAAWSIVHGFATLWLDGAFSGMVGAEPETVSRAMIRLAFGRLDTTANGVSAEPDAG
jgi:AcrR family transcriptional regulator